MKKSWIYMLAAACCISLAACQDDVVPVEEETPEVQTPEEEKEEEPETPTPPAPTVDSNTRKDISLTDAEKLVAAMNADFAFRFFRAVEASLPEGRNKQVAFSPVSLEIAFAMLANGAVGETQREILDALGFTDQEIEAANSYNQKLATELTGLDNTTEIGLANSLWLAKDFEVKDSYKELLTEIYKAEIETRDFALPETLAAINDWCSEKTNGCIKDFLSYLNKDACLYLLNALYFKAGWTYEFPKKDTQREDFTCEDGSKVKTDIMQLLITTDYAKNDLFAVARLPYGNRAFSLQVILPHEGVTLAQCIASLDGPQWVDIQSRLNKKYALLEVKLPKFKIELNERINEAVQAMGIQKAFTTYNFDFCGISDKPLMISEVKQATYFCTDEEGTEAAAITGIEMEIAALPEGEGEGEEIIPFHATRPFLFLLTEQSTGAVLFIGKMADV